MPPREELDLESRVNELEKELAVVKIMLEMHIQYTKDTAELTEKSLNKAEVEMNRRLFGMNEFREQLNEQTKTFMHYDTYMANHKTLEVKIESIQKIVWGGLAIVSFLIFGIQIITRFI
jgi:hypothetical protein